MISSEGYSRYRALTVKLDKRFSNRYQFTASYALSKLETTSADGLGLGGLDRLVNRDNKANFGTGPLDRTHRFTFSGIVELPLGFRLSSIMTMYSGVPATALVGSADLNGDGINGDLLPTTRRGALGREIDSASKLNAAIRTYNLLTAGKPLPRGGRAPFVFEVPNGIRFGDSFISQDFQLSYVLKLKERVKIEATAQVFNAFNVSNLVGSAGLPSTPFTGTLTNIASDASGRPTGGFSLGANGSLLTASGVQALAGIDRPSGFASFSAVRPSIPTGTGLPRAAQFGIRLSF